MSVLRAGSRRYAVSGTKSIIAGRHTAVKIATKLNIHGQPMVDVILPARIGVKNAPPNRARFVTAIRLPRSYCNIISSVRQYGGETGTYMNEIQVAHNSVDESFKGGICNTLDD